MPIATNSKQRSCIIRAIADETITLANTQVGGETVVGLGITGVYWTGDWIVSRGSNQLLVLTDGQDSWDLVGWGSLREWADQPIVLTQGTVKGTILLNVTKYNDQPNER